MGCSLPLNNNTLNPKTMKTIFTTLAFIVLLSGCATTKKCTCTSAWITYCNKYNINPHKATLEQENYFLDCYYGSTEYENDINNRNYVIR